MRPFREVFSSDTNGAISDVINNTFLAFILIVLSDGYDSIAESNAKILKLSLI